MPVTRKRIAGVVLSSALILANFQATAFAYDKALYNAINQGDRGDAQKVKTLLSKKKININARGRDGATPLSDACFMGNYEIVQQLLAKGARVNDVDDYGNTPLMIAVGDSPDKLRIMKLLIDKGADLNAINENGRTALAVANFNGLEKAAALLSSYKPQKAETLDGTKHRDIFLKAVKNLGYQNAVVRASASSTNPDELTITVSNSWHALPYQMRLQTAQNLWKTWAKARTGSGSLRKDMDSARIELVDLNGNSVGGSRTLGGSLIWVKK